MQTLAGKVALVTGGARGIGKAVVEKLAEQGCAVVINYYNSSDLAESLCAQLEQAGKTAIAVQANVADPESVQAMFAEIQQHFDHIDILVNNAASGVLKPAMQMKPKHWHWCMDSNALSLVNLLQAGEGLCKPGCRVLALSSRGSTHGIPNYAYIGASKAALESLVRALSIELAPKGISLNTISAGPVDTDALKYFPNREQLLEEYQNRNLAGRQLTPEDVANTVYLMCLPEAEMIKGQTITVDAGYSIIG
jgi:enoyl-[acyl-carrier protein] reductase III